MNCEVTMRWLDAYLDGELEPIRRVDLEAHLAACFTCKTAAEEAANFKFRVRIDMPVYKTPRKLKARIQAALRTDRFYGIREYLFRVLLICRRAQRGIELLSGRGRN
jgi:anti-sigma factor RsiW